MEKIIVAGAGHGGLVAAAHFAKAGYDVTVYEKNAREDLGYDWQDTMGRSAFSRSGVPDLPQEELVDYYAMSFNSPSWKVKLVPEEPFLGSIAKVERKVLIKHLVDFAESCGVKFVFGAEISCALYNSDRVTGILYRTADSTLPDAADMIIDAAGMRSPVRTSLPDEFGVEKTIDDSDVFYGYRAYFDRVPGENAEGINDIMLYELGNPGMNWITVEGEYVDVLIGSFGHIEQELIDDTLADLRDHFPILGSKVLRGGQIAEIPLRKPASMFVCNGYAAVGDSAFMTETMSGSGITMSMRAGKMLADTIIYGKEDRFDIDNLWNYQSTYMRFIGNGQLDNHVIRSMLSGLTEDDLNYLLDNKVLTDKEFCNNPGSYSAQDMINKGLAVIKNPALIKLFASAGVKLAAAQRYKPMIPYNYNKAKISAANRAYAQF
ncbi:MAG: NAD(P)/FAD-dependent oxidoreductase [Clostridia bacterium]|nr:NAD(P)/FAD-dependent oxidoreductase [Clostridia bacterium]